MQQLAETIFPYLTTTVEGLKLAALSFNKSGAACCGVKPELGPRIPKSVSAAAVADSRGISGNWGPDFH